MSVLLKALKQAETAHAEKTAPADSGLALESLEPDAAKAREWLEPPGMVFGASGLTPAPTKAHRLRMPQLSLVPAAALLAAIVALGYGVYLYYELQPPATVALPAQQATVNAIEPVAITPAPSQPPTADSLPAGTASAPAVTVEPVSGAALHKALASPQAPRVRAGSGLTHEQQTKIAPARATRAEPENKQSLPTYSLQISNTNILNNAYDAYQRGQIDEAQRLYKEAAARERSVDALLGLAAIAGIRNRDEEAVRLYREVLDRDPQNASAQAALLDLLGNTDRQATESRLKSLIERAPSAGLYQTLGNLYVEQNRWSDAQNAYFESFRMAPANADYAFNLAVSLDRLQQTQAALGYYEKALELRGQPRFDRAQAEMRIWQIKAAQP